MVRFHSHGEQLLLMDLSLIEVSLQIIFKVCARQLNLMLSGENFRSLFAFLRLGLRIDFHLIFFVFIFKKAFDASTDLSWSVDSALNGTLDEANCASNWFRNQANKAFSNADRAALDAIGLRTLVWLRHDASQAVAKTFQELDAAVAYSSHDILGILLFGLLSPLLEGEDLWCSVYGLGHPADAVWDEINA
jgi:hypothetical protein